MADFITRVELTGVDPRSGPLLDDAMAAHKFSKTHISRDGTAYELPPGTYFSQSSDMSAADVRNLAAAAIRNMGCKYDIVTVCGDIAYFLHPAR